jgi:DNA-binding response OmpR family regulator
MSRLLIVEDEAHIASGLCFNLEADGHHVTLRDNGEAALAELESDPSGVDLVVLDVMLPGMDGFAVASRMRAKGWLTPILMLTARGRAEDVLRGFEAGADDYLPKPSSCRFSSPASRCCGGTWHATIRGLNHAAAAPASPSRDVSARRQGGGL